MGKLDSEVFEALKKFVINEIVGYKALQGVSYVIDKEINGTSKVYERYKYITSLLASKGYSRDEIFRINKVDGGYVFDIDIGVLSDVCVSIYYDMCEELGDVGDVTESDVVNMVVKRRRDDMVRLANDVVKGYKNGESVLEIVLFNVKDTPRVLIKGKGDNGEDLVVKYKAYAVSNNDLKVINSKLLIPKGIRVARIQACEIIPNNLGVRYIMHVEKV
ncbi:MAG: hypothetical protein QXD03_02630 [Candidatus Anstonellales archaeon]